MLEGRDPWGQEGAILSRLNEEPSDVLGACKQQAVSERSNTPRVSDDETIELDHLYQLNNVALEARLVRAIRCEDGL